ncbi:DUF222 domain-containing protein [Agromyces bauzanensis]
MRLGDSDAAPGESSECVVPPADEARSPYALAQDGLAELVEAAVQAQRVEAMNAAMRVDLIFLTVSYALRSEEAFVAPSLSPQRRRELARRAVTAELATALHLPERTMEHQIDEAWALSTVLPATLGAMRDGLISSRHAGVIVDETADLDNEPALRARLDERLAVVAASTTAATLRRSARALREELQVESIAERHRAARAERRVELEPARDGLAWLHALLPAADALLIKDRLDRVARAAVDTGAHSDARVADQLRADAARDLLLHGRLPNESEFAAAVATARPTVHVTVPALTLIGVSAEPGQLDGYGPIDDDTARRICARAQSFIRLLTDPVSGTVLDVDRTSYRPPADLKRWLQVRDGTCRFPGCNRRAIRCETDHTIGWEDGGCTAFDNMANLCPMHHHLKHETSWSVRHLTDGVLEWRSPAGRTHVTHPGRRIPGGADSTGPPGRETGARRAIAESPPAGSKMPEFDEAPPF